MGTPPGFLKKGAPVFSSQGFFLKTLHNTPPCVRLALSRPQKGFPVWKTLQCVGPRPTLCVWNECPKIRVKGEPRRLTPTWRDIPKFGNTPPSWWPLDFVIAKICPTEFLQNVTPRSIDNSCLKDRCILSEFEMGMATWQCTPDEERLAWVKEGQNGMSNGSWRRRPLSLFSCIYFGKCQNV